MASTPRVPKAEITGVYGAIVKAITKKMLGEVPEPLEVTWHNKKVFKTSMAMSKAQKWDACDANLKSYANMAVSSLIGCGWCLDFGYYHAHNADLDAAKAREVPRWRTSNVFTPLERDVLEYAEAMSQTPPTVADELPARLLDVLGPAAMVELTAIISFQNMSSRMNSSLGIKSQGFSDACELPPLAQRDTLSAS